MCLFPPYSWEPLRGTDISVQILARLLPSPALRWGCWAASDTPGWLSYLPGFWWQRSQGLSCLREGVTILSRVLWPSTPCSLYSKWKEWSVQWFCAQASSQPWHRCSLPGTLGFLQFWHILYTQTWTGYFLIFTDSKVSLEMFYFLKILSMSSRILTSIGLWETLLCFFVLFLFFHFPPYLKLLLFLLLLIYVFSRPFSFS